MAAVVVDESYELLSFACLLLCACDGRLELECSALIIISERTTSPPSKVACVPACMQRSCL